MGELELAESGVFSLEELAPDSEPFEDVSLSDVEIVSSRRVPRTLTEALLALCEPDGVAPDTDAIQRSSWPRLRPRRARAMPPPLPRRAVGER